MKSFLLKSVLGIFLFALLIPGVSAVDSGIDVDATDTVAGYGALVRLSNSAAECPLELLLEKPDGSQVLLETEADRYGNAKVDVEGFYTKKAGGYTVSARCTERNESFGSKTKFQVYADNVSTSRSMLEISEQTAAANGNDYVQIKTHLVDAYSNPIVGHTVDLISSRGTDEVVRVSSLPYTNELGTMIFNVYSREEGVATFIAHDSTEGVTLNERARIAFYEPQTKVVESGGFKEGLASVLLAAVGDSGPVSYLAIEDLSEDVTLGSTLNFTVNAYDSEGTLATDYTGEVRFSSTDANATLPNDYLFEADDQGSHTFSLSLSFKTEGTHALTVTDLNNTDIFGEMQIEVTTEGTGQTFIPSGDGSTTPSGDGELTIFTPSAGTYSNSSITFSGEAGYGLNVEIFDNDTFLGATPATVNNEFTHQATGLEDGVHRFIVTTVNGDGSIQDTSDEIAVTIDTTPPELDHVTISPEGDIPAGDTFAVTVYSEKGLSEAGVIFNSTIFDLSEDLITDGVYEGAITAPTALGEYDIDILLIDEVGNEVSHDNVLLVNVIENLYEAADEETTEDTEEEVDEEELGFDPGIITGVEAVAGDGRVTLSWESPLQTTVEEELHEAADEITDIEEENETIDPLEPLEELTEEEGAEDEVVIDHYKIYYGPGTDFLFNEVETWDNSTTWYVPDLQNGSTYHFAIVPVDPEGNEGLQRSEAVNATPESDEAEALAAAEMERQQEEAEAAAQALALEEAMEEEEIPTETGPETAWIIAFSLLFTQLYFTLRKKRAKMIVPIQDIQI